MDILTPATILSGMMMAFSMSPHDAITSFKNPVVCAASAVYYEARNQPKAGQEAVVHLIMTSKEAGGEFGDTICGAVRKTNRFSYLREVKFHTSQKVDTNAWIQAVTIAGTVLNGQSQDSTNGALFYCNPTTSKARWCRSSSGKMIGDHKFVDIDTYVQLTRQ